MPIAFDDCPPVGPTLTDYDEAHLKTYLRLLDAYGEGASWQEAAAVIFGLDPVNEPERARRIYDAHFARARWMTQEGHLQLMQPKQS